MRSLNTLMFGDINFRDYGVEISGPGVYNAPERDITKYEVPGRNGDLIQDNGRFKNITVTYNCNVTEDFAKRADALRQALKAKIGYQELWDSYHPNEYRMGILTSGIEFAVGALMQSGTFDITFDCKPQRFDTEEIEEEHEIWVQGSGTPLEYFTLRRSELSSFLQSQLGSYYESRDELYCVKIPKTGAQIKEQFFCAKKGQQEALMLDTPVSPRTAESVTMQYCTFSDGLYEQTMYEIGSYYTFDIPLTNVLCGDQGILPGWHKEDNDKIYSSKPLFYIVTNSKAYDDKFHYAFSLNNKGALLIKSPKTILYNGKSVDASYIYFDTETMNAYLLIDDHKVNMNKYVKVIGNLDLQPGSNMIYTNNEFYSVKIYPRWFTI